MTSKWLLTLHDESNCFKSFFPGLIPNGLLAAFACSCHSMCSILHLFWQDQGIVAKGINFIQAQSAPKDDFIKKKIKKKLLCHIGYHPWLKMLLKIMTPHCLSVEWCNIINPGRKGFSVSNLTKEVPISVMTVHRRDICLVKFLRW